MGQLDLPGFPSAASLLWGTPHAPQAGCATQQGTLTSLWCQTNSASPTSVSLAVNERGGFLLLLLFCFFAWVFSLHRAGQEEAAHRGALAEKVSAALTQMLPWVSGCPAAPQDPRTQPLLLASRRSRCFYQPLLGGSDGTYFKPLGIFRVGIPCPCVILLKISWLYPCVLADSSLVLWVLFCL